MKKIKILTPLIGLTTLAGLIVPATSCSTGNEPVVEPERVVLQETEALVGCSNTFQLHARVEPAAASQELEWKVTEGDTIINIDKNGLITANATIGTAVVTVTPKGYDLPATCSVKVKHDFNTCSWETIAGPAKTLENNPTSTTEFCENFIVDNLETPEPDDKIEANALDDFVGQTRSLHLDSMDDENLYTVRVVGMQQDYTDKAHTKPVSLTFQFDTLVGLANGNGYIWDDNDIDVANNTDFWNSTICNLIVHGNNISGRIKDFSWSDVFNYNVVRSALSKETGDFAPAIHGGSGETSNYMFMPNMSDIFSQSAIEKAFGTEIANNYKAENRSGQPEQYQYYQKQIGSGPIVDQSSEPIPYPCLYKTSKGGIEKDGYWITTPDISDDTNAWFISCNNAGGSLVSKATNNALFVAPCFCI